MEYTKLTYTGEIIRFRVSPSKLIIGFNRNFNVEVYRKRLPDNFFCLYWSNLTPTLREVQIKFYEYRQNLLIAQNI
jgi:hypothetical protein